MKHPSVLRPCCNNSQVNVCTTPLLPLYCLYSCPDPTDIHYHAPTLQPITRPHFLSQSLNHVQTQLYNLHQYPQGLGSNSTLSLLTHRPFSISPGYAHSDLPFNQSQLELKWADFNAPGNEIVPADVESQQESLGMYLKLGSQRMHPMI